MQTIELQDNGRYREFKGTAARHFRSSTGRSQFNGPVTLTEVAICAYGTVTLLTNPPLCPKEKVQI